MELSLDDTIAALASAPGSAARSIVRISGEDVRDVLVDWFRPDDAAAWNGARIASVHPGVLTGISTRTDIGVDAYVWPNQRSYTGQPLVELHVPGSPPLVEAVLSRVLRSGSRAARPGEFTLRAFLAGKLDLLQAEAVLGVIDAHDHTELQAALSQLAGGISGKLSKLRADLLELLADLEAGLDFIEEDITFISRCELQGRIAIARCLVDDMLEQSTNRMQTNTHPRVVLAGLPNAGKSTLFNRLTKSETALVSPVHGTTRDFLVATVNLAGLKFDLIDTAGWEGAAELHFELNDRTVRESIATAAQQKRHEQIQSADLLVWCSAGNLGSRERENDEARFIDASRSSRCSMRILTQVDRSDSTNWLISSDDSGGMDDPDSSIPEVSAVSEIGIDELMLKIRDQLTQQRGSARQWLGTTAARCRESLEGASAALERAETSAATESIGDELIAVDVREALDQIGQILGTVYTDDILDRVFSKFCIGK